MKDNHANRQESLIDMKTVALSVICHLHDNDGKRFYLMRLDWGYIAETYFDSQF